MRPTSATEQSLPTSIKSDSYPVPDSIREGSRLLRSRTAVKGPPELNVLVHNGRSPTALGVSVHQRKSNLVSGRELPLPTKPDTKRLPMGSGPTFKPVGGGTGFPISSDGFITMLGKQFDYTDPRALSLLSAFPTERLLEDSIIVVGRLHHCYWNQSRTVIGSTTVSAISSIL